MFRGSSTSKEAAHHLLGRDNLPDDEVGWEEQSSALSERNIPTPSELWEQDPLHDQNYEMRHVATEDAQPAPSNGARRIRPAIRPEDRTEATTQLDAKFESIFNPVKKDQDETNRFHRELDAACAAFSTRLEEMKDIQHERERAIEDPWLTARRRREWQRFSAVMRRFAAVTTCYWGGTVAHLPDIPPQVPWPPPHLTRMQENHAGEVKALLDAHLAVVLELRAKYGLDTPMTEDGHPVEKHICVEQKLLIEVLGDGPVPLDDFQE